MKLDEYDGVSVELNTSWDDKYNILLDLYVALFNCPL